MGVRIQELPETTGINKEDLLIVEDGQGTKKGTVQQLDEALGVSQLKEDITKTFTNDGNSLILENNEVDNIYELKYLLDSNGITDLYNFAKRHGKVCAIPELGSLTIKNYWDDAINILLNRCGIRPAYCATWYNTSDKIYAPYDSTTDNGRSYISFLNNVCRGYDISLLK